MSKVSNTVLNAFVARMQEAHIIVQIFHWHVKSYSAHLISGELADIIHNFIDKYTETLVGLHLYKPTLPCMCDYESKFPHIHIGKLLDSIVRETSRVARVSKHASLDNLLDELSQRLLQVRAKVNTLSARELKC